MATFANIGTKRLQEAVAMQGELASLDNKTVAEASALSEQMAGGISELRLPLIWGSIRLLAVNGRPSVWRGKPDGPIPPIDPINPNPGDTTNPRGPNGSGNPGP